MAEKNQLSAVALDEVSLVDSGANQKAKVLLMKRDDGAGDIDVDKVAPAGIQFNIGFPEDGSGSEVQSVIFDSSKWDAERARKWLKDHDMVSEKLDETENTLRFHQKDPKDFARFRVIKPGKAVSKALKAKDSWQRMQGAVERVVREKFGPKDDKNMMGPSIGIWVRDFFEDAVVFDKDGGIFRCEYEINYDDQGEIQVTLGDAVPVEVVYQDIKKSGPPSPVLEGVPEELQNRVLKMRMDVLAAKLRQGR